MVGGGVTNPVGDFHESMQILESGVLQQHGIRRIGLASHPEGSPDISAEKLHDALQRKNQWAKENANDVQVYLETQWCMEAQPVIEWEHSIRMAGNTLPIHIGLPGPCSFTSLLKFAKMSGIGASMRVLTRQAGNLLALASQTEPDQIVAELASRMASDPDCLLQKMHFYSFGGLTKTARWAYAVKDGQFEVNSQTGLASEGFKLNS